MQRLDCQFNGTGVYGLPDITIYAGETDTLYFNLVNEDGKPFDAADTCLANFAFIEYHNKQNEPIVDRDVAVTYDNANRDNVVIVKLKVEDTLDCFGKYVYQLSLKSTAGDLDISGQGILNIKRNINKRFATATVTEEDVRP